MPDDHRLLVGDIGGTNARFAVAQTDGSLTDIHVLSVSDHSAFDHALAAYLEQTPDAPKDLCVASAGIRVGDEVRLTNAPWRLSESRLTDRFGLKSVHIINDFEAQAQFVSTMKGESATVLKPGRGVPDAPVLTLGPGTGFGQALVLPGARPLVIATEGGHRTLPVRDGRGLRLVERLRTKLSHHPILEDALSGRGLVHLYQSLLEDAGEPVPPVTPAEVSAAALASPGVARDAVAWFFEFLAIAAADSCFCTGARGGVVVSGGIVPKLMALFDAESFAATFARPGILDDYLQDVPISLVTEPYAALYGVANRFRRG